MDLTGDCQHGKINSNNANYYDLIMMSQTNVPIRNYKNPQIYHHFPKKWQKKLGSHSLKLFSTTNRASYDDSGANSMSLFNKLFNNQNFNISENLVRIEIFKLKTKIDQATQKN